MSTNRAKPATSAATAVPSLGAISPAATARRIAEKALNVSCRLSIGGKSNPYRPIPWENPLQTELEHLRIAALGELDSLADKLNFLAAQQSLGEQRGLVSRPGLPTAVSLGEWAPTRLA
jgi:hypothetical protein